MNSESEPLEESNKRALMTLSGGFDSAVAALVSIQQGYTPIFLYYDIGEFGSETNKKKVIKIARKLIEVAGLLNSVPRLKIELLVIQHSNFLEQATYYAQRNLTCILCKRQIFRIADEIAKKEDIDIIISGEILGEQASQTMRNLLVIKDVVKNALLIRPLLGFNKEEVVAITREYGLYELVSKQVGGCTANPKKPRTHATFKEVFQAETTFNIELLVQENIKNVKYVDLV